MKRLHLLFLIFVSAGIIFQSCKKEDELADDASTSIIPKSFKVDIPNSISSSTTKKSYKSSGDTLQGNEIYKNLQTFIAVGEGAADLVQAIMNAIQQYNINKAQAITYTENNRQKNLVVVENTTFNNVSYQYMLTISDAANIANADKGLALQVMWNTSPVKGIAIIKPINSNPEDLWAKAHPNAMYQIEYSEEGNNGYEAEMTVSIMGLTMPANPINDQIYSIRELKMFAGRKGDIIEVKGNSNHPLAKFTSLSSPGFNWAFVAAGYKEDVNNGVAVVELGLPPTDLNSTVRDTLLKAYSIQNVFFKEIKKVYDWASDSVILGYLKNADAPGYFDKNGFIQSKTAPAGSFSAQYSDLYSRIGTMAPYNPTEIKNMSIVFNQ